MADDDHEIRDDSEQPRRGADDAPLVTRVRAGDADAFGELYDRWFDRVLDLAYRILWDADAAADTAQEAFLSAWRNLDRLDDPHAFGGWLLRIARNAALDRKRKEHRARPVSDEQFAMIERDQSRPEELIGTVDDPAQIAEDASYVALLWDAADALGERDREVLDLHLRHGLAPAEIGDVVGINRNAANQLVHRVRNRLATAVGARMLWRGGQPACALLRAELVAADVERFDAEAVRVTDRHAAACDECTERKRVRLSPAQMFSAVPILSLPALKAKTAHALDAAGVPMQGSLALHDADDLTHTSHRSRRARMRRVLLGAAAASFVIVAVIAITAAGLGHDAKVVEVSVSVPSTVPAAVVSPTHASSSTSTTTSSVPSTTTTTAPAPPVVVPGTPTPTVATPGTAARTTTTTVPLTVRYTLEPSEVNRGYPKTTTDGPVLRWGVAGARRVRVYDDVNVFASDKASGSSVVCPDAGTQAACNAGPGTYTYALDAYDARGVRILHRTLTLTIQ